jgi:DNA-binding transcriptional LysR family regulator
MANSYYKQNHLKKLRAFCQTAKLGSMTKAAESLFASQPTISLQIHALEEEMDTILFERSGPKLSLTTEGSILYELCLPHVQGIDRLKETFDAHCGNLTAPRQRNRPQWHGDAAHRFGRFCGWFDAGSTR